MKKMIVDHFPPVENHQRSPSDTHHLGGLKEVDFTKFKQE